MYPDTINIVLAFGYGSVKLLWQDDDDIIQQKTLS